MKTNQYPPGWDENRIRDVIEYYEKQTEDEAVAEAEAALAKEEPTVMTIPKRFVPLVREFIDYLTAVEQKREQQNVR